MFFWPKFLGKLNFYFCYTTSVSMVIVGKMSGLFPESSGRYGLHKGSVTDGRLDGRTDIHGGKNNICLPLAFIEGLKQYLLKIWLYCPLRHSYKKGKSRPVKKTSIYYVYLFINRVITRILVILLKWLFQHCATGQWPGFKKRGL